MLRENICMKAFWEDCFNSSEMCRILFKGRQLLYAVMRGYAFVIKILNSY